MSKNVNEVVENEMVEVVTNTEERKEKKFKMPSKEEVKNGAKKLGKIALIGLGGIGLFMLGDAWGHHRADSELERDLDWEPLQDREDTIETPADGEPTEE